MNYSFRNCLLIISLLLSAATLFPQGGPGEPYYPETAGRASNIYFYYTNQIILVNYEFARIKAACGRIKSKPIFIFTKGGSNGS